MSKWSDTEFTGDKFDAAFYGIRGYFLRPLGKYYFIFGTLCNFLKQELQQN